MSSPDILDFERLLAPIPGDRPAGADLRQDTSPNPIYYRIKDARSAARAAERSLEALDDESDMEREAAAPLKDWRTVLDLAPKVLAEQTKDLEVTAWLIEGLVRLHGFAGLRDGFRLARGLVEAFWDDLYPAEDEEGVLTKVAPLAGLNGEGAEGALIQPIRKIPITDGADPGPFGLWHYEQASKLLEVSEEKREQRIAAGAVTLSQFEASAKATLSDFYRRIIPDLELCQSEFDQLNAALAERCGSDAPPSSQISTTLTAVQDILRAFGRDAVAVETAPAPADGAAPSQAVPGALAPAGLQTRDDAFRTLLKVAEFFRQTEPHSPISYTLEEVVRRGRMPLPELLGELISDSEARRTFFLTAGIKPPQEEG
ncbi:type VI secretion system protein TssA [Rhodospirillaceae bacterium SYSU D60014]|uniref:type VI secretion system protein TssA n=1 Tax=Virgifigura deserti TaxID=2268457 RepID=UPI000E660221